MTRSSPDSPSSNSWIKTCLLLVAGVALGALVAWSLPDSYRQPPAQAISKSYPLGSDARIVAGLAVTMAVWWIFEVIPVFITALLPLLVLPLTQARGWLETALPYGHKLVFLFLGGFVLALAMQKTGLHRRLALHTLTRTGTRPQSIVAGFMLITAGLSMWVSNTATTMMMLPIATSLIAVVSKAMKPAESQGQFATCLLLSIAYSASIGGLGTIIGSPPNALAVSFMADNLEVEISFVQWMMLGVPSVLILLPLCWWLLVRWIFPVGNQPIPKGNELFQQELASLGTMRPDEKVVFAVFGVTAACWIFRPIVQQVSFAGYQPFAQINDTWIALVAAAVLFVLPSFNQNSEGQRSGRLMQWNALFELPWGLLILFGGGLSLAAAIKGTGLSALMADQFSLFRGAPSWLIVLAVIGLVVFLTELTSNLATVAAMMPLLESLAEGLELSPVMLLIPAAMAGSCAFMLPVATPPNAIVYGSGHITTQQMVRAGVWLNLVSTAALVLIALTLVRWIVGDAV